MLLALFTRNVIFNATSIDDLSNKSFRSLLADMAFLIFENILIAILLAISITTAVIRGKLYLEGYLAIYCAAVHILIPFIYNPYLLSAFGRRTTALFTRHNVVENNGKRAARNIAVALREVDPQTKKDDSNSLSIAILIVVAAIAAFIAWYRLKIRSEPEVAGGSGVASPSKGASATDNKSPREKFSGTRAKILLNKNLGIIINAIILISASLLAALSSGYNIGIFAILFLTIVFPIYSLFQIIFGAVLGANQILKGKEFRNINYANAQRYILDNTKDYKVTIMLPIYDEEFDKIKKTIAAALNEINDFTSRGGQANFIIGDDGLMKFADNDIAGYAEKIRGRILRGEELDDRQTNFHQRMLFYESHPEIAVVARPWPVKEKPYTYRKGTFKKPGNLNYTLRLNEQLEKLMRQGMSYEEAMESVRSNSQAYSLGFVKGEIAVGEYILQLDKDSYLIPEGILRNSIPEFVEDKTLAFTQHKIIPLNEADSYYAKIAGYYVRLLYGYLFPLSMILQGTGHMMGHNAIVRKSIL
jgi:hypothetical protein